MSEETHACDARDHPCRRFLCACRRELHRLAGGVGGRFAENGLRLVMVLPPAAKEQKWCVELADRGQAIHFVPVTCGVGRCAHELAAIAVRENAAVLHTHFTQYNVPAWLAAAALRLRGRRTAVVWHSHSDFRVPEGIVRRIKDVVKYRLMGRSAWWLPSPST